MHRWRFIQSLTADCAEFSLVMSWLGPTMGNGILYNTWSDAGTGRYHAGDTSFVNDKVANFADISLLDEAPEEIRAVVTVCWLMKCLLHE